MPSIDTALKAVAPTADADFVRSSLAVDAGAIMTQYGLTGVKEQAQLLAHMSVETGGFRLFAENLNYRAERITEVFHSRFPTVEAARPYEHNPQKFANKVYGGRYGNTGPNDGWLYRGSGGLQHTFESEFDRVQKRTGLPVLKNPDMLRDKRNTEAIWRAACSYMVDRGALAPARAGDTLTTTKKINGGTNGLNDRKIAVARAEKALGSTPIKAHGLVPVAPPPTMPLAPEPDVPTGTGTPVIEHADPTQKTTAETEQDERSKRDKAAAGAATATTGSGPITSGGQVPKQSYDWIIVGGVVVLVALISIIIVRYFVRQHAEAKAALDHQQLNAIAQRVGM
jgi:putative chitinase